MTPFGSDYYSIWDIFVFVIQGPVNIIYFKNKNGGVPFGWFAFFLSELRNENGAWPIPLGSENKECILFVISSLFKVNIRSLYAAIIWMYSFHYYREGKKHRNTPLSLTNYYPRCGYKCVNRARNPHFLSIIPS